MTSEGAFSVGGSVATDSVCSEFLGSGTGESEGEEQPVMNVKVKMSVKIDIGWSKVVFKIESFLMR